MSPDDDGLAALAGSRIVGGCAACDAYQTLDRAADGIWHLRVHHDDWCPVYRAMQARRPSR